MSVTNAPRSASTIASWSSSFAPANPATPVSVGMPNERARITVCEVVPAWASTKPFKNRRSNARNWLGVSDSATTIESGLSCTAAAPMIFP